MDETRGWVMQETPRKYTKPIYTISDPRLAVKIMYRITQERLALLFGGK
jgi:hypothetical protein